MTNIAVSLDDMGIVTNVIVVGESVPAGFQEVTFPVKIGMSLDQSEAEYRGKEARALRDSLLAACDWTQVADAPVDQAAWSTYRQALRDLPDQAGFPDNVTWPEKP